MPRGLWTTTVGSFPKPPHLERARNRFARGEISEAELRQLEREATIEVIRSQEEIGLDILVDGELYRGDMTTYFAELMDGFEIMTHAFGTNLQASLLDRCARLDASYVNSAAISIFARVLS